MNLDSTTIALLIPVLLIELVLICWGLYDLTRPDRRVRGDSRLLWGLAIVFMNVVGPILYFTIGRKED